MSVKWPGWFNPKEHLDSYLMIEKYLLKQLETEKDHKLVKKIQEELNKTTKAKYRLIELMEKYDAV